MKRRAVIALVLWCAAAGAQDLSDLEQSIKQAREELQQIEKLTGENDKKTTSSERSLSLTRNKVGAQRKVVTGLDGQARALTTKIANDERQVGRLGEQLTALKKEFGTGVYTTWKNHRLNTATAFLLASRDFNDGVKRLSYLRRYNGVRMKKGTEIDSLARTIEKEIAKLDADKVKLDKLRGEGKRELEVLGKEEANYNSTLKALRSDRKTLEANAKKQRDKIASAQREIDRIMAEAARAAGRDFDVVLNGRFEENRGRLPWPVGGAGAVIDRFGVQRGADGISRDSKGITIATSRGAEVRALFDGVVSGVHKIGQFDKCVLVRSGAYVVLYGNLSDTRLKSGDRVALGDRIGRVNDGTDESMHLLMLQIWHETTPLDPEEWLR